MSNSLQSLSRLIKIKYTEFTRPCFAYNIKVIYVYIKKKKKKKMELTLRNWTNERTSTCPLDFCAFIKWVDKRADRRRNLGYFWNFVRSAVHLACRNLTRFRNSGSISLIRAPLRSLRNRPVYRSIIIFTMFRHRWLDTYTL